MRDFSWIGNILDPIGVRTFLVRREFGVIAMRQMSVANDTGGTHA
jgi:hypothetical protein